MDTETTIIPEEIIATTVEAADIPATSVDAAVPVSPRAPFRAQRDNRGGDRGRKQNRRSPRREGRQKPEFDQKIVSLRRVVRVVAGGRRFAFSVCVVAGNRKGMVGVGQGKASDTPLAIEKAFRDAKKNMITVNATRSMSVPHDVEVKYSASRVVIRPAPGKGILAGSSVRTVLELAGLREVSAKLLSRSKNSVNNAYAAIKALQEFDRTKIKHPKVAAEAHVK